MNSPLSNQQPIIQMKGAAKPSLEKKAYQELRRRIINGNYLPGTLLSENELADELNMSRTPIRAAISLLENEGFLETSRGRGVFVKEISLREFHEMFEVLVSMQLYAFDMAVKRGLSFDLEALLSHLDRQILAAEEEDYSSYYESYLQFVETIVSTVKNRNMLQVLEQVKGKYLFRTVSYRKMNSQTLSKPRQAKRANMQIYEALERGDIAGAKEAVYELNDLVYEQIKKFDM
ncbi:GntR family transcriptional regulator [Paenibacillus alkalitolerans]|uniref:GntR family transcriptional regulator n=1 Tax=Paenibacillus alkalitolerans TaxID=2799335 RepID=UPI001F2C7BA0|nr:GntR family transcriptional regulator [Paenibacillus alkalitolerans]